MLLHAFHRFGGLFGMGFDAVLRFLYRSSLFGGPVIVLGLDHLQCLRSVLLQLLLFLLGLSCERRKQFLARCQLCLQLFLYHGILFFEVFHRLQIGRMVSELER